MLYVYSNRTGGETFCIKENGIPKKAGDYKDIHLQRRDKLPTG